MKIRSGIAYAAALASASLTSGCFFDDTTPYLKAGKAAAASDFIVKPWLAAGKNNAKAPYFICNHTEIGPSFVYLDPTDPADAKKTRATIDTYTAANPKACTVNDVNGKPMLIDNITAPVTASVPARVPAAPKSTATATP